MRTAYFSSARAPGVVLRVSVMRSLAPSAAATKAWVRVAMPDSRCRKFSAVRSPASSAAAGPRTLATMRGRRDRIAVGDLHAHARPPVEAGEHRLDDAQPAHHQRARPR